MGIEKVNEVKVENGKKQISFTGSANKNRAYLSQPQDSVSFTGTGSAAKSLLDHTKMMADGLIPRHRKWIDGMESAKWLKGELGGILITALGTGIVAPIFIGFNPFVKAPKDATEEEKKEVSNTKLYTAMRQPISAILAIIFQVSVLKYIDKGLDKIFNNEIYSKNVRLNTDQSILNTDTYIESIVKKQMASENIEKPSMFRALFSRNARVERAVYNEKLKKRIDEMKKSQLDGVTAQFEKDGKILVNKKAARYVDKKTMADVITKQIDSYIEDAKLLKKEEERIAHYINKAEVLTSNEPYFRELAESLPLKEIEKAQVKELITQVLPFKEIKKAKDKELLFDLLKEANDNLDTLIKNIGGKDPDIKTILENLKAELTVDKDNPKAGRFVELCETQSKSSETELKALYKQLTDTVKARMQDPALSEDLKKELQGILDRSEDLRGHRVNRILARIESIKEICSGGFDSDVYKKAMEDKINTVRSRIVDLEICKADIAKMGELDEAAVKDMMKRIAQILTFDPKDTKVASVLKDTDVFGIDSEKLLKKLYKDVTKGYKKLVEDSYKSITQNSKMLVGALITIPITCTALNWVYPRVMELCFPSLAGVKKAQTKPQASQNGGDK